MISVGKKWLSSGMIKTQKNVDELVNHKCVEWKEVELKSKSDFFSTWTKHSKALASSEVDASTTVTESCSNGDEKSAEKEPIPDGTSSENVEINNLSRSLEEMEIGSLKSAPAAIVRSYDTPTQMKLQKEIDLYNEEIATLTKRKECGLFTDEMKKKREMVAQAKDCLKQRRGDMIRKRKNRKEFKKKLAGILEKFPVSKKDLKVSRFSQRSMYQFDQLLKMNFAILQIRESKGRPRLEVDQPQLLKAMIEIAIHGSACHDKRQEDIYRSVKSLDELHDSLVEFFSKKIRHVNTV